MKESKLYQQFKQKIKKADPDCFWYKIPDTYNLGGKKPFDGILLTRGVAFAIEFKSKGQKVTPYQKAMLRAFDTYAGGISFVFTEGVKTMDEFIKFIIQVRDFRRHLAQRNSSGDMENPFPYE